MADLKMIYAAPDEVADSGELESLKKWTNKYPKIYKSRIQHRVTPSTYFNTPMKYGSSYLYNKCN